MSLDYSAGDEIPYWVATIIPNGETIDFSSGWTFTATLTQPGQTTVTKTSGIAGSAANVVTVTWAVGELAIATGLWQAQLTAKRTADDRQVTVNDTVDIKARTLAGP